MGKLNDLQIRILEKQSIDCEDVADLMGEYVDAELSSTLKARVTGHVSCCKNCQEIEESYRTTLQLAAELKAKPVPTAVQNRLRKALNERLGLDLTLFE